MQHQILPVCEKGQEEKDVVSVASGTYPVKRYPEGRGVVPTTSVAVEDLLVR